MYLAWFYWQTRPRRPKEDGYRYIWVEEDGSAREVTAYEKEHLETKFLPGDGARPYIKTRYETLDGWGSISGYLPRRQPTSGSRPVLGHGVVGGRAGGPASQSGLRSKVLAFFSL